MCQEEVVVTADPEIWRGGEGFLYGWNHMKLSIFNNFQL